MHMGMLWMGGLAGEQLEQSQQLVKAREQAANDRQLIRDLQHHVARLSLLNQALWELVRDRLNLTDADLEKKAHDVDLRDGVEDGVITDVPLQCPRCGRVSNSRHWKCLYCGQDFERPAMA
jgi:lipopolysaccharide biosynthesis regulator YciM